MDLKIVDDKMGILISQEKIQAKISQMACEIDAYYLNQEWYEATLEPVVVIGILNGAFFFIADLVKQLSIRIELDFVKVSTYSGRSTILQNSKILAQFNKSLYNAHILLLDDILESGKTIKLLQECFAEQYPASITTAVLLRKPGKAPDNVITKFVGFDIPDKWVAGYGMDDRNGLRRELQYIFTDH